MFTSRSAFIHTIGHHADACTVFPFALGLLAQGHGPLGGGFGIASHTRGKHASGKGLFPDGIGPVSFPLGSRTNGNGIQSDGTGAAPDGQCLFSLCVGIIAFCESVMIHDIIQQRNCHDR